MKRIIYFLFNFFLLLISSACYANQYYASPTGTATGNGSISNPWSLQTALNHPSAVQLKDTIWLRGGNYIGFFTSNLNGNAGQYIYVIQYPGERATIADNRQYAGGATLQINGSWTIYKDFEIMNTTADRSSAGSHSFRPMGLQVQAPETKFINLIIHDVGMGFGFWKEAVNAEIYGCIIYNCGTANKPGVYQTHGHGIYSQNNTGTKIIRHNIIFNQFGFGIHLYPNPGNVNGYIVDGNTIFNNGMLTHDTIRYNNIIANTYPPYKLENISIINNNTYDNRASYTYTSLLQADIFAGSVDVICKKLMLANNYFMGNGRAGVAVINWDSAIVTGNTAFYRNGIAGLSLPAGVLPAAYSWNSNTYYGANNTQQFSYRAAANIDFTAWKSLTGFDVASTFHNVVPSSTKIIIQPNQYERGRANLIIYKRDSLSKVSIDLSGSGLQNGQNYKIVDAQNYFAAPLATGSYSSLSPVLNLSLTRLTTAAPVGMAPLYHTAPAFASLVIIPGMINIVSNPDILVSGFSLTPNPANAKTIIRYKLLQAAGMEIKIRNVKGQLVFIRKNEKQMAGDYAVELSLKKFPSGIYQCNLIVNGKVFSQKLVVR